MRLTFFGHACFGIETLGYRLVLDPFSPQIGYAPLNTKAFDWGDDRSSISNRDGVPGKNVWPKGVSSFRESLEEYYRLGNELGLCLLRLFSLSLGMAAEELDRIVSPPSSIARLLHYPAQKQEEVDLEQLGESSSPLLIPGIGSHVRHCQHPMSA